MLTNVINQLITNRAIQILLISLIAMESCQILKFIIISIGCKKPKWYMLLSTGGFPSSHASFCIALCLSLGVFQWHDLQMLDWSFAIAVVFSIIIIHDAMGVRLEASRHAKILNRIDLDLTEEEREEIGFGKDGKLKEMLGHRLREVLGGIAVGLLVGIIGCLICL